MPNLKAILRSPSFPTGSEISEDRNVVVGCQIIKLGKRGEYADPQGNRNEIVATNGLIDSMLAICNEEERITGHFTHDWILNKEEGGKTIASTFRNFRKDAQGNLIADAYLWPGDKKEAILHAAKEDPKGLMLSAVFDWTGTPDNPRAVAVSAIDFVEKGAITEALCRAVCAAADSTQNTMDIASIIAAIKDPEHGPELIAAIKAAIKETEKGDEEPAMDEVVAEDASTDDADKPAVMRAVLKLSRSVKRRLEAIPKTAVLTEADRKAIVLQAKSELIAEGFGQSKFVGSQQQSSEGHPFVAKVKAAKAAGADSVGRAILRAAQDHPADFNDYQKAINSGIIKPITTL